MKRTLLTLIAISIILLGGCNAQRPEVTTDPTVTVATVTEATGPVHQPFTGSLEDYTYYYADGRELKWEEDVLYTAGVFLGEESLRGHPLLVNKEAQTLFTMESSVVLYSLFYDESLRTQFLQDINDLIPRITELEDEQILLALQKAIAKLGDLNSYVHFPMERTYPIFFTAFSTDRGAEFRPVILPEESAQALLGKLVAINDVSVAEVTQKLMDYSSHENEYAATYFVSQFLSQPAYLEAIGITDGESPVTFQFLDEEGQTVALSLSPMKYADLKMEDLTDASAFSIRDKDHSCNYWWEYLEKEQTLYIRFNLIEEDSSLNYKSFIEQLDQHLSQVPQTKTVIVDLRGNSGGDFQADLSIDLGKLLDQLSGTKSYVLLDGSSNNAAILLSSCLQQRSPSTVLVGAPGGQPVNIFDSFRTYKMPNSGQEFSMSDFFWFSDENDTNDALMPDIVLHQTVEDYAAGIDTALEAILSGSLSTD